MAGSEDRRTESRFISAAAVAAVLVGALLFAPSAFATTLTCNDSTVDVTAAGPTTITPDCSSDGTPIQGYFVTQSPTHGTAQGNATDLTYTPQASGYDGVDSFQYVAYTDFTGDPSTATISNIVTVTLNVSSPPRTPPVCHNSTMDVTAAGPTTITPDCSSDGSPVQGFSITENPSHGTVQGNANGTTLTYTPQADGYDGVDSFQYVAYTDSTGDPSTISNTATVTLNVSSPPDNPPVCPDSNVFVTGGSYVDVQGYCVDPESDFISYGIAQLPSAGLMAYIPGSDPPAVRYWPCTGPNEPNQTDAPNWPGDFLTFSTCSAATGPTTTDQFIFTASDQVNPALQVHVGITVGTPPLPGQPTTYSTGSDATTSDPYQAAVTTDQPGGVVVAERGTTTPPPTGYQLLDQEFRIEAPVASSASDPLKLAFTIDASKLGSDPITVFRNGAPVQPCIDSSGTANPDPCVLSTEPVNGTDLKITVLTTQASIWNFGVSSAYDFTGFFSPVNDQPTVNVAKAGSAIPVKFSLNGDQGLGVFDTGYPKSQVVDCSALSTTNADGIESTVSSGASQLSYAATSDQYTYVWKTDKAWSGTCRQLVVRFNDQAHSVYRASFKFK